MEHESFIVDLVHPTGNQFVRELLQALEVRGMLGAFHTTLGFPASSWTRFFPNPIRAECARRTYPMPPDKLRTRPGRESLRLAAQKLQWSYLSRHERGWASIDQVYQDLDRAVARRIKRRNSRQNAAGVYGYEDGCLETFRAAKSQGLKCFYDLPIAYWETVRKLLEEESRRLPEWEPTLVGTRDSLAKLERKSAELALADVVICPSLYVLESLPPAMRREKDCLVAEFGSPPRNLDAAHRPSQGSDRLRVLFAGSLTQRKGLADVFAAMKLLNRHDVELIVMGSPIAPMEFYRSQYQDFTYLRTRPHREVLKLMQSCDVLVLPSLAEGRALVQQEALANGLPLIITKNTGGEDLIVPGETGFLVPIRSPDRIAEKISWLADHRDSLPDMRLAAIKKADEYPWQRYRNRILSALSAFAETQNRKAPGMNNLRTLLWIYLWLLIFEGALRKWIFPSLDAPLLVIRDPLVVWIYYQAWKNRLSFNNAFFAANLALAVATAILSTIFGSGNGLITLYGLRTDYLQIPLIFLIPQILNRDDVIAMGRFLFYLAIPMAVLMVLQFRSPPDGLLNKGALTTHYGTVRPSGPFSFISGPVAFFPLVSAFLFLGYIQPRTYKIWLLVSVTFALLIASACSGSRGCLVSIGLVAVIATLCVVTRGKGGMGIMVAALLVALAIPLLSSTSIFQEGSEQLGQRFYDAGVTEGNTQGFVARYANTMLAPFDVMGDAPLFGKGLGLGTNAAAAMLHGERQFIGPENEWGRLIWECGPIFGLLLCIFRIALTVAVARRAYRAFHRDNILPMLIFAACGLLILNGQWGVPTTLGFAIFGAGLTLAACVEPPEEDEYEHEDHHEHAEGETDHSTAADTAG